MRVIVGEHDWSTSEETSLTSIHKIVEVAFSIIIWLLLFSERVLAIFYNFGNLGHVIQHSYSEFHKLIFLTEIM